MADCYRKKILLLPRGLGGPVEIHHGEPASRIPLLLRFGRTATLNPDLTATDSTDHPRIVWHTLETQRRRSPAPPATKSIVDARQAYARSGQCVGASTARNASSAQRELRCAPSPPDHPPAHTHCAAHRLASPVAPPSRHSREGWAWAAGEKLSHIRTRWRPRFHPVARSTLSPRFHAEPPRPAAHSLTLTALQTAPTRPWRE